MAVFVEPKLFYKKCSDTGTLESTSPDYFSQESKKCQNLLVSIVRRKRYSVYDMIPVTRTNKGDEEIVFHCVHLA